VQLTGGGWVRDAGDKLLASGAEPEVVGLLVEAAKAKGWQAVHVWGPPEFVAECRLQFEAAGIPVSVGEEPPKMIAPGRETSDSQEPAKAEDIRAQFRRRLEYAERQLKDIRTSGSPGDDVSAAEAAERKADSAWLAAIEKRKGARLARKQAKTALDDAGFFARARARRAFQNAEALFNAATELLADTVADHEELKSRLTDTRKESKSRESRRRAQLEPEERSAEARLQFALECLQTLDEQPDLASQGADAVELATENRLAELAKRQDEVGRSDQRRR
jgi:hypothetical protein